MLRIVLAVGSVIGALAFWLWSGPDAPDPAGMASRPPAEVTIYVAERRNIADRTEALGTLKARESVEITTTVTETVAALHFEDGDWVEEGEVLAQLDQEEERAQLAQERTNLAEQRRELRRLDNLSRRNLAAETEVDQRRTLVARSEHRLQEIEARIGDRTLRAPFTGQLGLRKVSPGALVTPGTEITTLDDTRRMQLDFSVPATLVGSVAVGQPVIASSQVFERAFQGTVSSISSRINPTSRSFVARAEFDNPNGLLKPGLLMKVELLRQPRSAVVVPEESLIARQEKQFLLVVDPQTQEVSERSVTVGAREPGWAEVRQGLRPGEWVIREGVSVVQPGAAVIVKNQEMPTGAEGRTGTGDPGNAADAREGGLDGAPGGALGGPALAGDGPPDSGARHRRAGDVKNAP